MEPAVKVIHGSTRRVWVWKLSARMLALVASICAIGLVGSFLAALNADHIDYGGGDYVDAIFVITLVRAPRSQPHILTSPFVSDLSKLLRLSSPSAGMLPTSSASSRSRDIAASTRPPVSWSTSYYGSFCSS